MPLSYRQSHTRLYTVLKIKPFTELYHSIDILHLHFTFDSSFAGGPSYSFHFILLGSQHFLVRYHPTRCINNIRIDEIKFIQNICIVRCPPFSDVLQLLSDSRFIYFSRCASSIRHTFNKCTDRNGRCHKRPSVLIQYTNLINSNITIISPIS